jgi:hypothetical protein
MNLQLPELFSGDMIMYRNGDMKIVLLDTVFGNILTSRDRKTWAGLNEYDLETGIYDGDHQYDIVEVYRPVNKYRCLSPDYCDYERIWIAPAPPRRITMGELQELLGYPVEIVG